MPTKYTPPPGIQGVKAEAEKTSLTKGFSSGVYNGTITGRNSVGKSPILHLFFAFCKNIEMLIFSCEISKRATNYKGNLVTIKVNSQNSHTLGL